MQGRNFTNGDGKDAAARLMKLKGLDESDADFARRLGLTSQHIHNWDSGAHGLSLNVAMKIAPKLTDAEIVYVVAGRELDSPESLDAAYVRGLREAFATARAAIEAAEEDATAPPGAPQPGSPPTPEEQEAADLARQRAEAERAARQERERKMRGEGGGGAS